MKKVLILGAGPGGYAAALKLAGKGFDITIVEADSYGGTCLNVGCIPTKVLLHQAKLLHGVKEGIGHGLQLTGEIKADWAGVQKEKKKTVKRLVKGVEGLLKGSKIRMISGEAVVQPGKQVKVSGKDGETVLDYDVLVIATGSEVAIPPIPGVQECKAVIDSTDALSLDEIPKRLAIIGGGVIGVEFASAYRQMGSEVVVYEAMPHIVPNMDEDISDALKKSLEEQGITVHVDTRVESLADRQGGAVVKATKNGESFEYEADKVLVAVGRRARYHTLQLENIGVETTKKGIVVDDQMRTSVQDVYAIGDVTGNMMLAHAAYLMAEVAADVIAGGDSRYTEQAMPSCIYTIDEVASVGMTERQAKEQGVAYKVVKSYLLGNGMALIESGGAGFVKVLVGEKHQQILGMHMIGKFASEIISQGVQAIMSEQTAEEFLSFPYPHPSVSEAVRETVLETIHEAIHEIRK